MHGHWPCMTNAMIRNDAEHPIEKVLTTIASAAKQ